MNGITYYRLKSDYTGDYTKNCALNGTEVDNNFYVLESRDVKSISVRDKDIILTFNNGDIASAEGVLDFVKTSELKTTVINVEFDKLNGILKLTNNDGSIQYVEGFATNENTNFSVSTDNTLCGDGLRNAPLGVSSLSKTGQYKPVKAIINVSNGGILPNGCNLPGDRYLTCEDISNFGYLYDYCAVRDIACELKNSGWRIPTKADWDDLLNAIEPCDCDKTHNKADKNKYLGKWAGKLLKSKTMWMNCDCESDCSCNSCCDDDDCNCNHKHNCACEQNNCSCGKDVCFDYTDDPCVGTKESSHNCKCESKCNHRGLDAYGFTVTPAGYADDGCNYGYFGERSAFWTATTDQNNTKAYIKRFQYNKDSVYQDVIASNYHLSLRLIKDYDGKNYNEVEQIMDMEYPTLLLPSISKGKAIWTSCNFACGNASLNPMLPNNGQGLTYTRHYFINEWDGFKWVRNEVKQGESVVVEKNPKGKSFIEYMVVGNELVNVNDVIAKDVVNEIMPIIENTEKKLNDRIELTEEALKAETEERKTADNEIKEELANVETRVANAETRLDNAETRVANAETRLDNAETRVANAETRLDNAETRISNAETRLDNAEARLGNTESRLDNAENRLLNAETRISNNEERLENVEKRVENTESRLENAETRLENAETRLENAETRISNAETRLDNTEKAIVKEISDRKDADEVIEGKLLTEEGTEFDSETGKLTLKSAAGTNDITVQFSFNFGTF